MKSKLLQGFVVAIALILQVGIVNAQPKKETKKRNEGITSLDFRTTNTGGLDETQINYREDGHYYKIKLNGTRIAEIYLDDKKVPEEDFSKYEPMVKKILVQVEKDRKQAEKDREQAEKDREQADRDRQQADKDREQAELDRKQADKDRENAEKDRKQADKERVQVEQDRKEADKDREQAEQDRKQAGKDREQAELDRKQADKDRAQAEIDRKQAEEDRRLWEEMVNEMVKEKLVEDRQALKSMLLDDKEFTVNGVKQSEDLHSKFKAKYLKGKNKRMSYINSEGIRGITVD
ncbi:MAG: hypothetical protein WDO16_02790 [Bacteroidota bacterium]